jgi:hypothetical protein
VKVRKEVLPHLAEINPKIIETLAQTAELLTSSTPNRIKAVPGRTPSELRLTDLRNLAEIDLYAHVRTWLRGHRGDLRGITLKHVQAIARLVNSPKSGRLVELPGGGQVVKGGGRLAFRHIKLEY